MKKTLRKDAEVFFSHSSGRIAPWDAADEDILVEAANQGLMRSIEERTLMVPERIVFEESAAQWLISLLSDGVTERL